MTPTKLTHQQQEIIKQHYTYRFLSSTQIQKFLNHKSKGKINIWLPYLVKKEYLNRIYDPSTFLGKNQPAVYFLGNNGIRWLKTQEGYDPGVLQKLYRDKNRSKIFISTCQLVADICLDLKNQPNNKLSFEWATENEYTNSKSPLYFSDMLSELRPDLVFTRMKNNKTNYYLLEILTTKLPAYRVRKRIRTYLEFLTECEWIGHIPTAPEILFVSETKELMIRCKRYAKKLLIEAEEENIQMSFAQKDEVQKDGVTAEIWEDTE
ncbi:MAG TPA: replication-relaxation family protein [Patescibacteria group bacterium]|nr:replication-relaxation family protein [Patescibacteria group bacterium]